MSVFHPDILSKGGGQTRVLEMLRRGGINHQTVWQISQNPGGGTRNSRGGRCIYLSLSPQVVVEVSKTEL